MTAACSSVATRNAPRTGLRARRGCTTMSAPIFTSASVKPSRFSYTVSCTTERPLGLREGDDERLLPVGHEAGVHVGLDDDGLELAATTEEDAVLLDVEPAAGLAEDVEERQHLLLLGAADEDLAVGRQRRATPRRRPRCGRRSQRWS